MGSFKPKKIKNNFEKVELLYSEKYKITSKIVKQDFDIYVSLPQSYFDNEDEEFPVIYVLSAQWDFSLVDSISGNFRFDGLIQESIVIGIAHSGVDLDYDSLSERDYTPEKIEVSPVSGGGKNFLMFLESELIPDLESKYVINEDRCLVGASRGGLFALYAMFERPNLFSKYIISSPLVRWGNGVLFNVEEEYSKKNNDLSVQLYVALGELEDDLEAMKKFFSNLCDRNYDSLRLEVEEIASTGHAGNKPMAFYKGMLSLYRRTPNVIDEEILNSYVGDYQIENSNNILNIFARDGKLFRQGPNGNIVYFAESSRNFYVNGRYELLKFSGEQGQKIVEIYFFGGRLKAKKI